METTLIIIVVCMIISAFFSASEMAFSSLNRVRIKSMAEQGNSKAQMVLKMLDKYDDLLSTILVGNNVVNILCSSMATVLFIALLDEARGPGVATIVTTVVVLLFGEISPKSIAKESPEKFAMALASILNVLVKLFTPINWLFGLWKKSLVQVCLIPGLYILFCGCFRGFRFLHPVCQRCKQGLLLCFQMLSHRAHGEFLRLGQPLVVSPVFLLVSILLPSLCYIGVVA